ncbi:YadA C-terminal domain-containing protein [Enterobacter sp. 638]|uniref:YadA C-terminal domain protein n=1 Tax=Enterobacter sp. (strain 638) TaxID=399742 RepID=A0A9J9KYQ9_ENT38|nr:YadA C-terminal domain-containing protein [Enterobacter sp. 638]ABP62922.1 YadA C-terminal domain protein [Enterobacter sp. 638]
MKSIKYAVAIAVCGVIFSSSVYAGQFMTVEAKAEAIQQIRNEANAAKSIIDIYQAHPDNSMYNQLQLARDTFDGAALRIADIQATPAAPVATPSKLMNVPHQIPVLAPQPNLITPVTPQPIALPVKPMATPAATPVKLQQVPQPMATPTPATVNVPNPIAVSPKPMAIPLATPAAIPQKLQQTPVAMNVPQPQTAATPIPVPQPMVSLIPIVKGTSTPIATGVSGPHTIVPILSSTAVKTVDAKPSTLTTGIINTQTTASTTFGAVDGKDGEKGDKGSDGKNGVTTTITKMEVDTAMQAKVVANTAAIASTATQTATVAKDLQDAKQVLAQQQANSNAQFKSLKNEIDGNKKEARSGVASAIAIASMPQVEAGQSVMFSAGVGSFKDEQALSVGASFHAGEHAVIKAGISDSTNNDLSMGAGVGIGF